MRKAKEYFYLSGVRSDYVHVDVFGPATVFRFTCEYTDIVLTVCIRRGCLDDEFYLSYQVEQAESGYREFTSRNTVSSRDIPHNLAKIVNRTFPV